jgi:hypothetical protein
MTGAASCIQIHSESRAWGVYQTNELHGFAESDKNHTPLSKGEYRVMLHVVTILPMQHKIIQQSHDAGRSKATSLLPPSLHWISKPECLALTISQNIAHEKARDRRMERDPI